MHAESVEPDWLSNIVELIFDEDRLDNSGYRGMFDIAQKEHWKVITR